MNADSMQDRMKATEAAIVGCANGDLALIPMPVPRGALESMYWDRKGKCFCACRTNYNSTKKTQIEETNV